MTRSKRRELRGRRVWVGRKGWRRHAWHGTEAARGSARRHEGWEAILWGCMTESRVSVAGTMSSEGWNTHVARYTCCRFSDFQVWLMYACRRERGVALREKMFRQPLSYGAVGACEWKAPPRTPIDRRGRGGEETKPGASVPSYQPHNPSAAVSRFYFPVQGQTYSRFRLPPVCQTEREL